MWIPGTYPTVCITYHLDLQPAMNSIVAIKVDQHQNQYRVEKQIQCIVVESYIVLTRSCAIKCIFYLSNNVLSGHARTERQKCYSYFHLKTVTFAKTRG